MTDHVCRRYPDHADAIHALMKADRTFSEICDDYDEMCTWLMHHCRTHGKASEECLSAMEIIKDLEDEIDKMLNDSGLRI